MSPKTLSDIFTKGEFETTAAFEARVVASAKKPLTAQVDASSLLAFVVDLKIQGEISSYDADTEFLGVLIHTGESPFVGSTRGLKLRVDEKILRTYEAQNGFGAKFNVIETESEWWSLILVNADNLVSKKRTFREVDLDLTIRVNAETAQRTKNNLGVLVVGRVAPPYMLETADVVVPTSTVPRSSAIKKHWLPVKAEEIWLYNSSTGEILKKLKPK